MSSNSQRSFKVYKIDNGTVIDHINSSMALKIIDILEIKKDGIVQDASFKTVGHADGIPPRWAAFLFFFL